ncbi:MAG: sugar ABC transporter permease [Caldilineaceae bacterium]|nr:sugar ABC transporter permease [Caldilineaceae bacterium]
MQATETGVPALGRIREGWSSLFTSSRSGKWDKIAIIFVAPWLIHLALFTLYPLYIALYGSVANWNILTDEMEYVGFVHYARLLSDERFFLAIRNSFVYLIIQVPASIIGGFLVALMLNQANLWGRMFLRGVYFLPVIIPTVVMAIIWQWMFATNSGVINYFLSLVGISAVPWLTSPQFSMPSIGLMKIWNDVGFYAVLFLAGLQGIPQEVTDAAKVDGVNDWQMSWYIKVPLLNPVVVFSVIMGTLWGLNIFVEPLLMTNGGPRGSSLTTLLYLYHEGFIWSRIGYANAIGVASTILILIFTLTERRLLERTTY